VFVHRTNLLDVLDGSTDRADNVVLAENEVRPVLLKILAFREADAVVRGVVLEARGLERDRRARMLVVVFAVAGWIRVLVPVSALAVPTGERLTEFLENSLTRLRMEVGVAFVLLEVRHERIRAGNLAALAPDTLGRPSANVPEFAGGESERIEVVAHLRVVADAGAVGACDDLFRHT
jgi:hypothetical protein